MTVPYLGRLACLSLAAFFLAHTALAAVVSLASRGAIRRATQMRARVAARLVFALRLLPATAAGFFVGALCVPGYFLLEPKGTTERIGPACLVAALLGFAICGSGLVRGALAAIRSAGYVRRRQESDAPVFLLAGVFRPRLIVSPSVRDALTPDEFEAALRHEEAHGRAQDNLKRLLILMSPDVLPFVRGFRALDACWRRLAEWAADDCAVEGSPERALALASALVRVGRTYAGVPLPPLGTSLVADANDLGSRVERLIEGGRADDPSPRMLLFATACIVVAVLAFERPMLHTVYRLLEALAH
jgi:hypothetical protein